MIEFLIQYASDISSISQQILEIGHVCIID